MNNEITLIEKYLTILSGLFVFAFTAYSQSMISGFVELFSGMEGEIPKITQLVFATYRWWVLLAVMAILGIFYTVYFKSRKGMWLVIVPLLISFVLLPVMVWSMYAPIL